MAELHEMGNGHFEIDLPQGGSIDAKRPTLGKLFKPIQEEIIDSDMASLRRLADEEKLEGIDRQQFLLRGRQSMPRGAVLNNLTWDYLSTPDGIARILHTACELHSKDYSKDAVDGLLVEDLEYATSWAEFLCGVEKKTPARETNKETTEPEKETDQETSKTESNQPAASQ